MYVPKYTSLLHYLQNGRMPCDVSALASPLLLSTQFSLKGKKEKIYPVSMISQLLPWCLKNSSQAVQFAEIIISQSVCVHMYFMLSIVQPCAVQPRVLHAQGRSRQVSSRSWVGLRAHAYLQVCQFVSSRWKPGTPQCIHLKLFKPGLSHPSLKEGGKTPRSLFLLSQDTWGWWAGDAVAGVTQEQVPQPTRQFFVVQLCRRSEAFADTPIALFCLLSSPRYPLVAATSPKHCREKPQGSGWRGRQGTAGNGAWQAAPHGLNWRKTKPRYPHGSKPNAELRVLLLRAHAFLSTYVFQGV